MKSSMTDQARSGVGWGTDTGICAEADAGLRLRSGHAAGKVGGQRVIASAGRAASKCQTPAATHTKLSGRAILQSSTALPMQDSLVLPTRLWAQQRTPVDPFEML